MNKYLSSVLYKNFTTSTKYCTMCKDFNDFNKSISCTSLLRDMDNKEIQKCPSKENYDELRVKYNNLIHENNELIFEVSRQREKYNNLLFDIKEYLRNHY